MFQYAFASIIAKKNKATIFVDTSSLSNNTNSNQTQRSFELNIFNKNIQNISLNEFLNKYVNTKINKIKRKLGLKYAKVVNESSFKFDKKLLQVKSSVYLSGYFQSYKYFIENESFIKGIFRFPFDKIQFQTRKYLNTIESVNAISVHVRRGDYVLNNEVNSIHGVCGKAYYLSAINYFKEQYKEVAFFFFSDDINWVKESFNDLEINKYYVDLVNEPNWVDMFLMTKCKHNIIANSSFSFWGAWLNNNLHKEVIAPKQWFTDKKMNDKTKDLLPKQWIKL